MKLRYLTACVLAASCFCLPAFADSDDMTPDLPAPDIGQYTAYPPPPPNRLKEFFDHVYIAGIIGGSYSNVRRITLTYPTTATVAPTSVNSTDFQKTHFNKGLAVGYILPSFFGVLTNRVAFEYMDRNFDQSLNPPFNNVQSTFSASTFNTSINSQTFLAKWYMGLKTEDFPHFIPFVVGGVGAVENTVESNGFFKESNLSTGVSSNLTNRVTNLAYEAGGGFTYIINSHLGVDLDYELVSLGNLYWTMSANDSEYSHVDFSSKRYYAHTINLALTCRL